MKDDEISEMAARLEAAISAENARCKIVYHDDGPDESHVVANRAGYLRLAELFLRAAVAPLENEDSAVVEVDSSGATDEDSDVDFAWLERQEKFEKFDETFQMTFADKLLNVGCVALFLAAFALLIIGAGTVVSWL